MICKRRREYACDNGQCIPISKYCDGKSDCTDNSDEILDCNVNGCAGKFQCAYSACIDKNKKCDGKNDCWDNSDENMCDNLKLETCLSPVINNGDYKVRAKSEYKLGTPIPNHSFIDIFCTKPNYELSENYSTVTCVDGKLSPELPKCVFVVSCPTTFNYAVDVNCTLNEEPVDCNTKSIRVGTVANMKCKPNFIDKNPEISKAMCTTDGSWDVPLKECTSPYLCPPRPSTKINVHCKLHEVEQDCSKEVPNGTVSYMDCKPNYIDITNGPPTAMCLNGSWTAPLKNCTPECKVSEATPYIVKGFETKRGEFPWHVGIYREMPQEDLKYICGGSIISVKVVLSAAHCFIDESIEEMNPVFEYSVAAGKLFSDWDANPDENYVQARNVTHIYTNPNFRGNTNFYVTDIAIVVVDKLFDFSNLVSAVCVDWNSEYTQQQLKEGSFGKVAGWGLTNFVNVTPSANLKQLKVPFVDNEKCNNIVPSTFIKYITLDKFCAGSTNGSSVCNGDSGSGLVFSHTKDNRNNYYIQGIVSAGPTTKDGICNSNQLGVYTKVNYYISFIRQKEELNRGTEFCILPTIANAKIIIESHDPESIVDDFHKNYTEITIECNMGYTLVGDNTAKCISGQWDIGMVKCIRNHTNPKKFNCPAPFIENGYFVYEDNPNYIGGNPILNDDYIVIMCNKNFTVTNVYNRLYCENGKFNGGIPTCVQNCAPISSLYDVEYEYQFEKLNENSILPADTIATVKCKPHYTDMNPEVAVAICKRGSFNLRTKSCIPECGELISTNTSFNINDGAEEKIGKFSWHVAIYRQILGEPLKHICSGSIISEKVVLSARHCFYSNRDEMYPASEFSIAAGKHFSDWDAPEDADFVQKRKVFMINPDHLFDGFDYYSNLWNTDPKVFTGALAAVIVDAPFTYNNVVKPVCFDRYSLFSDEQLRNSSEGQVNGWRTASSKNSVASVVLEQSTIEYIDRDQCIERLPQNYQEFLTEDKFCVGYKTGSNVCNGDSGGSLVYPQEEDGKEKYFIQGILTMDPTINDSCDDHKIGIYTKVTDYMTFITRINIKYKL